MFGGKKKNPREQRQSESAGERSHQENTKKGVTHHFSGSDLHCAHLKGAWRRKRDVLGRFCSKKPPVERQQAVTAVAKNIRGAARSPRHPCAEDAGANAILVSQPGQSAKFLRVCKLRWGLKGK